MEKKRITDLIDENYVRASVLFHFGIEFYSYKEETLSEACAEKGLNVDLVIKELETIDSHQENTLNLHRYPIDLIITYLKHSHYTFAKKTLPFIARLILCIETEDNQYKDCINDLKFIFPLLVEDSIEHMHDEEDTLFAYIGDLLKAMKGEVNYGKIYYMIEQDMLSHHAIEHSMVDDTMQGIREICMDYKVTENTPLSIKVLFEELKNFEKSLIKHSKIENEILFPKALNLEKAVKNILTDNVRWN